MLVNTPQILVPSRSIRWKDDRNAANHAEFLDFARRASDRQIERMLSIMPIFPDAPEIVVPTGNLLMPVRRIVCPNEFALVNELMSFGPGLEGHKAESSGEAKKESKPPCETCRATEGTCGPDITADLTWAVLKTRKTFPTWDEEHREGACKALTTVTVAGPGSTKTVFSGFWDWATGGTKDWSDGRPLAAVCWDIQRLHFREWLDEYRPTCAQGYCGDTVRVADECHYAGSANYVIFGAMCKLCDFSPEKMLGLIWLYKGDRRKLASSPMAKMLPPEAVAKLSVGPAGNYEASKAWAIAGYSGWPSGNWPPGDRNDRCKPNCSLPYPKRSKMPGDSEEEYQKYCATQEFKVIWQWVDKEGKARDCIF